MAPTPGPIVDPRSPSPATAADSSRDAAQSTEFSGNTVGNNARIHLGHKHLALCVLQQAIRSKVAEPGHIFTNARLPDAKAVLPKSYSIEKSTLPKNELSEVYSVEILLLSMVMQAKAARLVVKDTDIDDRPESFVQSLTSILVSALKNMGEDRNARSNAWLNILLSSPTPNFKVTFLAVSTHDRLLTIDGLECLESLEVSKAGDRRVQIADPAPGSNSWVWNHPALQHLRNSRSGALAIIGKPGSGKSVLGKTIVQELGERWDRSRQSSSALLLGEWFYCRRLGETFTAYTPLLKFVVWKFLTSHSPLFSYCKATYRQNPPNSLRSWTEKELEEILKCIIEDSVPLIMVFDAIDESNGDKMAKLVALVVDHPRSRTKAIFLSRPVEEFNSDFWKSRQFKLQDENRGCIQKVAKYDLAQLENIMYGSEPTNDDGPVIRTYAALRQAQSKRHPPISEGIHKSTGLKSLKSIMRGSVSNDADTSSARIHTACMQTQETRCAPRQMFEGSQYGKRPGLDTLEQHIIKRANGVILWVVLVFTHLCRLVQAKGGPPSIDELLSIVDKLPEELEDFYGVMAKNLTNSMSRRELGMAQSALKWVNTANQHKQFTIGELWDALAVLNESSSSTTNSTIIREPWDEFRNFLFLLSGSFVEIIPPTKKIALTEEETGHPRQNVKAWENFQGTMRQLRRSLAEHVIPIRDAPLRHEDFDDISEDSVIQLMHQTVKEFLTSSGRAGTFSFTEEEAFENVLQASATFVELALPGPLASISSTGPDTKTLWSSFIAKAVRYLDDVRLLSFCFQLLESNPYVPQHRTGDIRAVILPDPLMEADGDHIDELRLFGYTPSYGLLTPVLGILFFFAAETGLKHGALNYLRAINLDEEYLFATRWGNDSQYAIFMGTIMTMEFHHHAYQYILSKPRGDRAILYRYLSRMPDEKYYMSLLKSTFVKGTLKRKYGIRGSMKLSLDMEGNTVERAEKLLPLLSECAEDKILTKSKVLTIVESRGTWDTERLRTRQINAIIKNKKSIASIMSSLLESSE
ncbi:hypothetical protein PG991_003593 [Apiospora marii]|uniref:Nephrocystin 3-like N-terminal domain-containing protein n=1 Tax=Apiospora marii TaxID=335849 RepID=A0ABR1S3W4_9PEZI